MASSDNVVIVGAGIGGLTAALSLLKNGIDVDIYEQASELKDVGAGIQTSSNGTRVLYALGLQEALAKLQVTPSRREIRHWLTGETWNWFDLGNVSVTRYGTPHIMMHRGDLQEVLANAVRQLKPAAVHLGMRCAGITQTGDRAEVRLENGPAVSGAYVIGADGIHSQVREALFGPSEPTFVGCVAWRGLVPMEKLPPHIAQMVGVNWLGPRGHVLHYPVRRGEIMNYISFVERSDWQIEFMGVAGHQRRVGERFRGMACGCP